MRGSASTPSGETCRLSSENPLTSNVIDPLTATFTSASGLFAKRPRRSDPQPAVALHFEGRRTRESPRVVRGGHERRAGVGRLLGHDLDVGEGGQGCGSQERVGCRRRKSCSLQLGRVDGHACDGQGIGGTTLREQAEVPFDERGGAVELAVEGRCAGAERREEQHADDREQGEIESEPAAPRGCRNRGRVGGRGDRRGGLRRRGILHPRFHHSSLGTRSCEMTDGVILTICPPPAAPRPGSRHPLVNMNR